MMLMEVSMNELGAISSYALTLQQLQLNVIKDNIEMQQQVAETLLDPERMVQTSADKVTQIDISI